MESYCRIEGNRAIAFDGVVAIGQTIQEDLTATPHTKQLVLALERCGEQFAITQLSSDRLLVRSGDFQAFVPCCDPEKLPEAMPDPPQAPINDKVADALKIVAALASDKAESVLAACIQLHDGSVAATNLEVIIEAWHGCSLPEIVIPRAAAVAVVKSGRSLAQFGLGQKTATFWFDDNSWIRTQLYLDKLPDLRSHLDIDTDPREIAPEFFEAIKKIAPFSVDGKVYCGPNNVSSHSMNAPQQGGQLSFEISNGLKWRSYSIKMLNLIKKHATKLDEHHAYATLFFGDGIRGAVVHNVLHPDGSHDVKDEDIPF